MMGSRKDVERQFSNMKTLPLGKELERRRNALMRKAKAEIKDEERAADKYFKLYAEAHEIGLPDIANDFYRISGEEFTHKVKLEEIVRKLGGKV